MLSLSLFRGRQTSAALPENRQGKYAIIRAIVRRDNVDGGMGGAIQESTNRTTRRSALPPYT